jgi:hypothetical protein
MDNIATTVIGILQKLNIHNLNSFRDEIDSIKI